MKALCIRSCTVPGLGLVEKGQTVDIPEGAWEKHFEVQEAPKHAAKAKKAKEADDDFLK